MSQWTDENGVVHFSSGPRTSTPLEKLAGLQIGEPISVGKVHALGIVKGRDSFRMGTYVDPSLQLIFVSPLFQQLPAYDQENIAKAIFQDFSPKGAVKGLVFCNEGDRLNCIGNYTINGYRGAGAK